MKLLKNNQRYVISTLIFITKPCNYYLFKGIFPLAIFILRLIESTREYGKGFAWPLRLLQSFSYGYGLINLSK